MPDSVRFGCRFGIRHIPVLKLVFDRPEKLRFVYFHVFNCSVAMYVPWHGMPMAFHKIFILGLTCNYHSFTPSTFHGTRGPDYHFIGKALPSFEPYGIPWNFHMFLLTSNHHGLHSLGIPWIPLIHTMAFSWITVAITWAFHGITMVWTLGLHGICVCLCLHEINMVCVPSAFDEIPWIPTMVFPCKSHGDNIYISLNYGGWNPWDYYHIISG